MIIGFASGFVLPNAIAGAVSVRPQAAGAAAGITGFMQMGLGAVDHATASAICSPAPRPRCRSPCMVLVLCAVRCCVLRAGAAEGRVR